MILKKISLQNIRSYKNEEIEFPLGSILLAGDIGSGKSSILLAVEFALFGLQRGKSGDSLLRNGEKEGKVKLNFDLDGKEVIIERTLKKSKDSVQQENCSIEINKEKKQLSTNELKSLVLNLFNYPAELFSKNPALYRYTVYTPQEEMKSILQEDAELRMDTLRRVFNIDKYKRIIENSEKLMSKLREEIKIKQAVVSDIESKKNEILMRKDEVVKIKREIATFSMKLEELKKIIAERKNKLNEFEEKIKELNRLKAELASTKAELFSKKERLLENKENVLQLKNQISSLEEELKGKSAGDAEKISKDLKSKEKDLEEKENELLKTNRIITTFEVNKERASKIANDIIKLQNCPTCRQDVSETHKTHIKEKNDSEVQEIEKNLSIEIKKKEDANKGIAQIKDEIRILRVKDREFSTIKIKFSNLDEKKKQIAKNEETSQVLEKSLSLLEKKKDEIEGEVKEFLNVERSHEIAKKMLDEVREDEKIMEISKARFERQLEDIQAALVIFEREIEEKEKSREKMMKLAKLRAWIEEEFIPSVINIEKNVMAKLHYDFSNLFGKWFSMLANDLNARLNEEFSPIIEQQGYEIDYSFLSGGERTAAALAYRLALNQVINSIMSEIKTKDILILDEPTDGFSSEQLDKMRDVLHELNVKQLILVSHEQKIESFVDNIIRISKEEGFTQIK